MAGVPTYNIDMLERVGTSFLDPIFILVSYSGAPKDSNGRHDPVMRQHSQKWPFGGCLGAYGGAQAADGV